ERGFLLVRRRGALSCEAALPEVAGVPGSVPPHLSRSVLARALEGQAVLSTDLAADDRFRARMSVRRLGLRSVLAVLFPCKEGADGILYLDARVSRACFREEDLDLLIAFASQGALALEHAWLIARASELNPSGRLGAEEGSPSGSAAALPAG